MKTDEFMLDVPYASVTVRPFGNGYWEAHWSFMNSFGRKSQWYPRLEQAKYEAGAEYKWYVRACLRKAPPKRLRWKTPTP